MPTDPPLTLEPAGGAPVEVNRLPCPDTFAVEHPASVAASSSIPTSAFLTERFYAGESCAQPDAARTSRSRTAIHSGNSGGDSIRITSHPDWSSSRNAA